MAEINGQEFENLWALLIRKHISLRLRCDYFIDQFELAKRIPEVVPLLQSHVIEDVTKGLDLVESYTVTGIDVLPSGICHREDCPWRAIDWTLSLPLLCIAPYIRSKRCETCDNRWRSSIATWIGGLITGIPEADGYITSHTSREWPERYKVSMDLYHRIRDVIRRNLHSIDALYQSSDDPSRVRIVCELSEDRYRTLAKTKLREIVSARLTRTSASPPPPVPVPESEPPKYSPTTCDDLFQERPISPPIFSPPSEPPSPSEREEAVEYRIPE